MGLPNRRSFMSLLKLHLGSTCHVDVWGKKKKLKTCKVYCRYTKPALWLEYKK